MLFVKKIMFGLGAILFILWGGAGTQSSSTLLQGGGFMVLLVGLVILYLFLRMAWRAMGCLPSFLIFSGRVMFILYAIGAFNGGIGNVGYNLKNFLGQQSTSSQVAQYQHTSSSEQEVTTGKKIGDFVDNISEKFNSSPKPAMHAIDDLPLIRSSVRVISGDILQIQGYYFRIYGIDAPENNQNCEDKNGRSYRCGLKSASWLRDWILDYELECRIMQQDQNGNMVGICSLGQYDIGAAMVTSGWAVAATGIGIYEPYELEARQNKNGLWSGSFYRPEDWRKLSSQKPNIKIIKPKNPNKKSIWGF